MRQQESLEAKHIKMTTEPVPKLICSLAVPTIISMLVTAIYNMADTFFVGKLGTNATASVGVAFSLMCIIQAIGFTFGMGSGNYISRLLGKKEMSLAHKVATTGFLTAFGTGVVLMVLGCVLVEPLVGLLGATKDLIEDTKSYVQFILIGMPFMIGAFVMNNLLRYQGNAVYAMLGIGAGGILNIFLDPLFIFGLDMGVGGAALATIISQVVSFSILFYNCKRRGLVEISFKHFTPKWYIYKEIFRGGLPSFYRQGLASLATIILNLSAGPFGEAAMAAMSVVTKIFQFALSALLGFGQGFQPVCGYNYGAGRYERVLEAYWFCIKTAFIFLSVMAVIGFMNASWLISLFRKDDMEVMAIGTRALRYQCVTFPLSTWIVMNNMLMQTIGEGTKASLLALARQGLFFIPIILLFSRLWQVTGIQMSQPIADICTFILAVPLGISVLNRLKKNQDKINQNN